MCAIYNLNLSATHLKVLMEKQQYRFSADCIIIIIIYVIYLTLQRVVSSGNHMSNYV